MNGDYIIKGDIDGEEYLIYICGTYDNAIKVLDRILNNPTEYDKKITKEHKNLRIEFAEEKDCWWKYYCD